MTEIDVPDWVVEVACHAAAKAHGDYLWPEEWMDGDDATLADEARATIRAALTAALGAWVVPAFFATGGEGDFTLFTEFTDIDQAYAHAGDAGWVVEAYALRQEKPNG